VTDVVRFGRQPTLRPARELKRFRWTCSILAVVAVCFSSLAVSTRPAGASSISNDKAKASVLYGQINRINARVDALGQKYDEVKIKLDHIENQITNTKAYVATIKRKVSKGVAQLRSDAIFAYVTNGSALANNPLFTSNSSKVGATNVYNQLAEGNVGTTLAGLKTYRIELTQERAILTSEDAQAASATRVAAKSFHEAKLLQSGLTRTLSKVKGQIANFIAAEEAAAAAKNAGALRDAKPSNGGYPAPPPDSRANIAIDAAESFLGVPYVWGGASRGGVDCSGLVMLAYEAAGIDFPHYSGAQYEDTERVPLWDIKPGDLLFYGYNGDEHVAMYVGHGDMIEAPETGEVVHITPIRLGYGFAGLGRPRA
jgi:cell wall-associated NlpC family hydrolase